MYVDVQLVCSLNLNTQKMKGGDPASFRTTMEGADRIRKTGEIVTKTTTPSGECTTTVQEQFEVDPLVLDTGVLTNEMKLDCQELYK